MSIITTTAALSVALIGGGDIPKEFQAPTTVPVNQISERPEALNGELIYREPFEISQNAETMAGSMGGEEHTALVKACRWLTGTECILTQPGTDEAVRESD
jgi:hypothetical protein